MSMRLWPALACLLVLVTLPASAAARVHHGSTGAESDEAYYPGDYDGYGGDWPDDGNGGGTIVGAAPQAPTGPVTPTPAVPEQDAPFVPTPAPRPARPPPPPAGPEQDAPFVPPPAPGPVPPVVPAAPTLVTTATVPGKVAMLRSDGKAAIPRGAPQRVRAMIAAANQIVGKPYKWGGGHAKLIDRGYDCSGAVSYSLRGAGLLGGSMVSGSLAHWAAHGDGRWMTVYANNGHVYMEIAGLRFDTSPVGDPTGRMGVRWRPVIGRRGGFHARHAVGL